MTVPLKDGNNNAQSALVKLEMEEMMEGIRQDGIDKVWWDCECRGKIKKAISLDRHQLRNLSQAYTRSLVGMASRRPTPLLESQRKMEDGSGLDDLDLWAI